MISLVPVPQAVIDEHTLIAQTYVGFLFGHSVHAKQYTTPLSGSVTIDFSKPWTEPNPMPDDCIFCQRLTDEEATRRVAGYQAAIDKEVLGGKFGYFRAWVLEHLPDRVEAREAELHALWRQFIEETQHRPIPAHLSSWGSQRSAQPDGWKTKAASIVSLPLRLKRKMVIDWNHCYVRWMATDPSIHYDFDKHEFFKTIDVSAEFYRDFMGGV